jgi:hypothetical protein
MRGLWHDPQQLLALAALAAVGLITTEIISLQPLNF